MAHAHRRLRRHGLHGAARRRATGRPGRAAGAGGTRSEARLSELAARLGGLEIAHADAMRAELGLRPRRPGRRAGRRPSGRSRNGASPPCARRSPPAATYLDSTGEPAFIRRVFEEFDAPAAPLRRGAADRDGLRLRAGRAGRGARARGGRRPEAVRVDVGYYALGGTASLAVGGHARVAGRRDARRRPRLPRRPRATVRPAERVRSFMVAGKRARGDLGRRRRALRAPGRPIPGCARSTSTSAGSGRWPGRCRRARWSASTSSRSRWRADDDALLRASRRARPALGPRGRHHPGRCVLDRRRGLRRSRRAALRGPPGGRRRLRLHGLVSWPGRRSSRYRAPGRSVPSRRTASPSSRRASRRPASPASNKPRRCPYLNGAEVI